MTLTNSRQILNKKQKQNEKAFMKNLNFRSKKGNAVLDLLFTVVIVFIFALFIIGGYLAWSGISTELQADPDISDSGKAIATSIDSNYPAWFDNAFLFVFLGLWIAAMLFAYMIDTLPIYFVVTLILLIFILVVGAYLSNAYEDITTDGDLGVVAQNFPIMNWIFSYLVEVITVMGLSITLVLYAKRRNG